ncbi:MAG: glycosyl hydrolase family protein [Myxococcales bacterium]|nr:MAG: glycosyl hydrolase family protein [Myxococcales bacterium]
MSPLQLWGGVECTVNRVGDRFHDQLERSGHARRLADLEHIAALGLRRLRYPVLWERTAPRGLASADFSWADERLGLLRALGVEPIVGLVHHGSGPAGTSLLEDSFVDGLAAFAGAVARRYPWVDDYTPVNEPLTTARFSALYGHWYPHRREEAAFVRALLVQTRATIAAMAAVRRVNPHARLVQTEDFGHISSSPRLRYQADFENARRWLSFDLLTGRVRPDHPLYGHLRAHGASADELGRIADAPCPPDVLGLNYYVTSDRYLDEAWSLYPATVRGGNGRDTYADVESVRVPRGILGHQGALEQAWARYRRPVAVTEAHLGCSPDEQVRWLAEAWQGAEAARQQGVDVRAVTVWSLLGAHDWSSLVTRLHGHYEPGVFALDGDELRPTELAGLVRSLASSGRCEHPALALPGWWRRPERVIYNHRVQPHHAA